MFVQACFTAGLIGTRQKGHYCDSHGMPVNPGVQLLKSGDLRSNDIVGRDAVLFLYDFPP